MLAKLAGSVEKHQRSLLILGHPLTEAVHVAKVSAALPVGESAAEFQELLSALIINRRFGTASVEKGRPLAARRELFCARALQGFRRALYLTQRHQRRVLCLLNLCFREVAKGGDREAGYDVEERD